MRCPDCNADNRAGRRFCGGCGAPLPLECPACGFANDAGEKFCGGCGKPLGGGPPADASPPSAPPSGAVPEGERRPITVLFADLAGYTQLSQKLDPEAVHALLERYFDRLDAIVLRWGGTIDKHIGDALMALFGAPTAHGDDPLRAVRAAIEMQSAMPALAEEIGRPLGVHIGIAAGEVIASGLGSAGHRAYTVIGQSVNLAARLLGVAKSGEIVVDETVHAQTRRSVRYAAIEQVRAKGIDAPLTAFRVVELAPEVDEPEHAFVGREAELAQLVATLDGCASRGEGGTVLVRGEAGIGKSRLVAEMRRLAGIRGYACHTGLVLDFGMAEGRDPVRAIVAGVLGISAHDGEDARRAALERWTCGDEHLPFLLDLVGLPQTAQTRAVYEAMDNAARQRARSASLCRLLGVACEGSPRLVTIEDVHWADAVALAHLAALARAAASMPLVLVMTTRLQGDPIDLAWRAQVQGSPLLTLDLGPLAAKDALALAGTMLSTTTGIARQCVERAAGNPLFLEQLLRAAAEDDERLPASLHSLVLSRVDRLPERDRGALRAASVVGQQFALDVVRHLARLPDYRCDALVEHFLVRPEGDEWMFAHALIRDGVYASLTHARRAELHRAAAEWYAGRDLALVAEHLDRAGASDAAAAYLAAARSQAKALRLERALALADRGVEVAKEPADVVGLQLLRSEVLRETGEGKPATEAALRALAAAREPAERCHALLASAAGMRLTADVEGSLAALAQAEPLAASAGMTRELVELHYLRGNVRFAQGRIGDCRSDHEAALGHARTLGDPAWEARALSGLADADYAEGRVREAGERFARCVRICDAHGLKRIALANRAMVGNCLVYLLDPDGALREMRVALGEAREVGNRFSEMFALECLGLANVWYARYAEATEPVEQSLSLAESIGARRYEAVLRAIRSMMRIAGGELERARDDAQQALGLSREFGMPFCGPIALQTLARLSEAAESSVLRSEAETILAQGSAMHCHVAYHRDGIEDALDRGHWDAVERHASALESFTAAEPLPYTDLVIARGRVLAALGRTPDDPAALAERARLEGVFARVDWRVRWS